jgi:hypothetical protein
VPTNRHRSPGPTIQRSAFVGFRWPAEVITAVRSHPRYSIRLRPLTDGAPYGFALGVDIAIRQMTMGSPLPNPNNEGFHADRYAARRPTSAP